MAITSGKYLLLPGDTIIPNNLTMPDHMDVLERCLFLLMPQHLLQVGYGHTVIDVMGAEGMPQGMYAGLPHPFA